MIFLRDNLILHLLLFNMKRYFGDWGLGIGDWGLGIGPNPQSPIPKTPIPHPQTPKEN